MSSLKENVRQMAKVKIEGGVSYDEATLDQLRENYLDWRDSVSGFRPLESLGFLLGGSGLATLNYQGYAFAALLGLWVITFTWGFIQIMRQHGDIVRRYLSMRYGEGTDILAEDIGQKDIREINLRGRFAVAIWLSIAPSFFFFSPAPAEWFGFGLLFSGAILAMAHNRDFTHKEIK